MAVIYLKHDVHGTKVATSDLERDYDLQHGWKVYNPDTPSVKDDAAPVNALEVKRRGRPSK